MIQEIITYLIIGSAVTLAIIKIYKKFWRKKIKKQNIDFKKNTISMQHNCSDCSAECMLRDAAKPIIQKNKELCNEIQIKSD